MVNVVWDLSKTVQKNVKISLQFLFIQSSFQSTLMARLNCSQFMVKRRQLVVILREMSKTTGFVNRRFAGGAV